jgi:NTP pyrophosphatase (non-canonical NTP hydrolase)
MKNQFELIREWAETKGIYEKGDVKTQYVKLQEEAGELAKAIIKDDYEEFVDAIGDCVVVLTSIAELGNKHFNIQPFDKQLTIEECIDTAYNVIAKRTGKMINGTFVKD